MSTTDFGEEMVLTNLNIIKCKICNKFLNDIEECENCNSLFCKNCVNEKKNINDICPICLSNPFKTNTNELITKLIFNNKIKILCKHCKNIFNDLKEYEKHISECPVEHFYCKECPFSCFTEDELWNHLLQEHEDKILQEIATTII
jgi:hypothetical protein